MDALTFDAPQIVSEQSETTEAAEADALLDAIDAGDVDALGNTLPYPKYRSA